MSEAVPGPAGRWFDGSTSRGRPVRVDLLPGARGPSIRLVPLGVDSGRSAAEIAPADIGWPEAWSAHHAPSVLVIDLGPHGSLQVHDVVGWQRARTLAGARPSLATRMLTHWPVFLSVLLVSAIAVFAFYRWGTPWVATWLARQVPPAWERSLGQRSLQGLDDARMTQPTRLDADTQARLRERFGQVLAATAVPPGQKPELQFRAGMGVNAFALPGGTVVLTDGLVRHAGKSGLGDEALAGVMAHELGHAVHRHGLRMLIEQGVLSVGLGLVLGDVSNLLALAGTTATGLAYSRRHEVEADCHALAVMRRAGLPVAPMADLLETMEQAQAGPAPAPASAPGPANAASASGPTARSAPSWEWLSSHPATPDRANRLRAGNTQGC